MNTFGIKPEIKFGKDSLNFLKTLPYKKYLIVTDETMVQLKLTDNIVNKICSRAEGIKIFSKVLPNPTIETVREGILEYLELEPECIIALGGGSPIDACKVIMYFGNKILEMLGQKKETLFIAVPTTSGTGSEVTSYSVITDGERKLALAYNEMLPNIAILNPEFMKTLPAKVVADTGMDVFTHAIEALVSKIANPFTDALGFAAIEILAKDLLAHYENRDTLEASENVQFASCMAGIAFNNSSLGINHSIAHTIGAKFHIAHGRANAILLPYIIEVNTNATAKYAELARRINLPCRNIEEGRDALKIYVEILKEKLAIPKCLAELGIDFEDFKNKIPEMLQDIKKDICTEYNPNSLTDEEYVRLLFKIYFGR